MRILLTNDDGIYAPGLRALRVELQKLGDVTVVAPATEQSGVAHSITFLTPLLIQEVLDERSGRLGWAVEGRPADCVKLALVELLPEPPDLVVSGLNAGANAGINVLYSGTVAAAVEGAFFHRTSIAVSLESSEPKPTDFGPPAALARTIVQQIIESEPPTGALFNVNLPAVPRWPVRGVRVVAQDLTPYAERFIRRVDPKGRTYFWTSPDTPVPKPVPESDVTALAEGYATVTPLQFNLTHEALLQRMSERAWRVDG